MNVLIYTSDPTKVDPAEVAEILSAQYFVLGVDVNDGERVWVRGD